MKCFCIYERSNSGKSAMLRYLTDQMIKAGEIIEICFDGGVDRVVRIRYRGKVLGITSRGDSRKTLEEDFEKMGECDFYITAARSKGETRELIRAKLGDNAVWQRKWRLEGGDDTSFDAINQFQAQKIKERLDKIL